MLYRPAKTFLRHRDKQTTSARMQSGRLLHTKFAGHVVVKQNIRGFQIAVKHLVLVQVAQGIGDLPCPRQCNLRQKQEDRKNTHKKHTYLPTCLTRCGKLPLLFKSRRILSFCCMLSFLASFDFAIHAFAVF